MDGLLPIAFLDSPKVIDTAVTPIPGSGSLPLQVVANLGVKATLAIDYLDTTGDFIGVYSGAANFEQLTTIIGGGTTNRAYVVLPAKSRISLRSITASPITSGYLSCIFMGY